jgi:hypothetical protein
MNHWHDSQILFHDLLVRITLQDRDILSDN